MKPFVFSCDAHIAEPANLFLDKMPAHLQKWALHQEAGEGYRIIKMGDVEALKVKTDFHSHKTGQSDAGPQEDRSCTDEKETFISDCAVDTKRRGARDMALRLADMDRDGVDAELVFPSLGLVLPRIPDRDGQVEGCKIYNDWALEFCASSDGRLVPAAMIPCIDLDAALQE